MAVGDPGQTILPARSVVEEELKRVRELATLLCRQAGVTPVLETTQSL